MSLSSSRMNSPWRPGKDKLRADMIAVGGKNGAYFPVFIELKNGRELTTLKGQLNNANAMLWENDEARGDVCQVSKCCGGREG